MSATARPNQRNEPPQITSLLFDHTSNLVWCADSAGYTCSYTPVQPEHSGYGLQSPLSLYKYTKFRASPRGDPVLQQLNNQKGIFALSKSSVTFNTPRGLNNACLTLLLFSGDEKKSFGDLSCMTLAYATSTDIIVGGKRSLMKVDVNKPSVVQQYNHDKELLFVNHLSKLLALGNTSGSVDLFDTSSNEVVKSLSGHSGLLSDLDVKGNYIATCGYSARPKRYGSSSASYVVDPLVNIYDLRMMRAVSPIPFPAGASFAKFYPKLPNIVVIASTTGQIQFVDMYDQLQVHLYQADLSMPNNASSVAAATSSYMINLDVSDNGEFLAFSDGHNTMSLWGINSGNSGNFVNYPTSLDLPEVTSQPSASSVGLDEPYPLNSVGMPYYKEFLTSYFPAEMIFTKELLKTPAKIDQELLDLSERNPGKILPYDTSKYGPRNVVRDDEEDHTKAPEKDRSINLKQALVPKFISERSATSSPLPRDADIGSPNTSSIASFQEPQTPSDNHKHLQASAFEDQNHDKTIFQYKSPYANQVPSCYSRLEIQYSRFGVDDFDFDYYNQTGGLFCGLENHLDNSYANSLIQIYRFLPIFYSVVTGALLEEWLPNSTEVLIDQQNPQGSSVLNELGYLFDMMHKAEGRNVSINNFSLILSDSPIAKAHGLIIKDDGKSLNARELQKLMITFNKFLVESVVNDYAKQFNLYLQDMTSMHYELNIFTNKGEHIERQTGSQATLDLMTPPMNIVNRLGGGGTYTPPQVSLTKRNYTLLNYLEYSLNQSKVLPPSNLNPYPLDVTQTLTKLGPLLLINIPFSAQEYELLRHYKKWLVPEFYTTLNNNKVNFKPVVTHLNQETDKYELLGYSCQINHDTNTTPGKHNMVSYIKIKSPASGKNQWFLFNDFLVMTVPEDEVFNLSYSWKKPVVLVYHNVENPHNQNFSYYEIEFFRSIKRLDDSILYRDHFACGIREGFKKEYELLTREEAPEVGTLVALDAEFVSLKPEVAEVRCPSKKRIVRPKVLSLARISALRGDKNGNGVPFIDDYIVHTKPIFDNLTEFSGIEEGDLDPNRSTKTLVTLQTAYRRLWLLLNLGCIFVGHGLKSDFRCINLQVPKSQIRDTIELFYLADFKRKLSLKFLAYVVLHQSVQTSNHDSIEDAKTALLLYQKYLELKSKDAFERTLNNVYNKGYNLRFKVPDLEY